MALSCVRRVHASVLGWDRYAMRLAEGYMWACFQSSNGWQGASPLRRCVVDIMHTERVFHFQH
eukprot:2225307-Amphidinium_carterae.1